MSGSGLSGRGDRARAFVPALIPEPKDLDRTGPLDAKEERDLARVHEARDHYGAAKWMRGKALEAVFRRRLYRGENGTRTRQEYLDDEWDGMSETAAYREIQEWPLAAQICEAYGRPAADSHVRALVDAAEKHGHRPVAAFYAVLRRYGAEGGRRVTAEVVENLAEYLTSNGALAKAEEPGGLKELEGLFAPRRLPSPRQGKPSGKTASKKLSKADPVEPSAVIPKFGNGGGWRLSEDQIRRLSDWIAGEAARNGKEPDEVADLVLDVLMDGLDVLMDGSAPVPTAADIPQN